MPAIITVLLVGKLPMERPARALGTEIGCKRQDTQESDQTVELSNSILHCNSELERLGITEWARRELTWCSGKTPAVFGTEGETSFSRVACTIFDVVCYSLRSQLFNREVKPLENGTFV